MEKPIGQWTDKEWNIYNKIVEEAEQEWKKKGKETNDIRTSN